MAVCLPGNWAALETHNGLIALNYGTDSDWHCQDTPASSNVHE